MAPQKPTGQTGPITVGIENSDPSARWKKIEFPRAKADIERFVFELWLSETRKAGGTIYESVQNPEDDFDFTLQLPGGPVHLDLTEIFYHDGQQRPYDGQRTRIKSYRFAEQVFNSITAKSDHYGKPGSIPIHLLTYITHWRFSPSEVAIRLVQHFLLETPPIIENVFFLEPFDATAANLRVLFPSRNPLEGHDPEEFREHGYLNLDPSNWQIVRKRT